MNNYELLAIFSASLSDPEKDAMTQKYAELIEKEGGKVTGTNKWGNKKLAYPINYKTEGYYVLYNFAAPANVPAALNARLRIDENVMRYMCVKQA